MYLRTAIRLFIFLVCTKPLTAWACFDVDGLLDVNCDGKVKVLAFGDSITYGIGDEQSIGGYPGRLQIMFPNVEIISQGNPGENTYGGRNRAPNVFSIHPDADFIIILEGVNDYFRLTEASATHSRDNLLTIRRSAESHGAIVLLANLIENRRGYQRPWVLELNAALARFKNLDFFSLGRGIVGGDLLHPNAAGYEEMAEFAAYHLITASNANRPIDTDGDGVYDYAEAIYGTSPTNPDSDGDTIKDGLELFKYGTNPLSLDSDNDGYPDKYEIERGANPASATPAAPKINAIKALPRQ